MTIPRSAFFVCLLRRRSESLSRTEFLTMMMKNCKLCLMIVGVALVLVSGCIRWPDAPKPVPPVPTADKGK